MWILFLSSVGIPLLALVFFFLVEFASSTREIWDSLQKASLDLCNVSIGIVGGLFLNERFRVQIGSGAPVISIAFVMINLVLAAVVLVLQRRFLSRLGVDRVS